ncbi:MAG: rhodanese-like domain-containing protein [Bacteroidota bacterium]|jgi:rhodanese-related sulfurtransferase
MPKIVTREMLQARLAASPAPVLLEALPAKYYREGHLPGALHFPHDRARALAQALIADKGAEIVVYCASETCRNSHIAAETLAALGYSNVGVYAGGKKDWVEGNLPLENGGQVQDAA